MTYVLQPDGTITDEHGSPYPLCGCGAVFDAEHPAEGIDCQPDGHYRDGIRVPRHFVMTEPIALKIQMGTSG